MIAATSARRIAAQIAAEAERPIDDSMFLHLTHISMLIAAGNGLLDINQLAREELACRGLDTAGKGVGFDRAEAIARSA